MEFLFVLASAAVAVVFVVLIPLGFIWSLNTLLFLVFPRSISTSSKS